VIWQNAGKSLNKEQDTQTEGAKIARQRISSCLPEVITNFPVFLAPHKKADCLGGSSIFNILSIIFIIGISSEIVQLFRRKFHVVASMSMKLLESNKITH